MKMSAGRPAGIIEGNAPTMRNAAASFADDPESPIRQIITVRNKLLRIFIYLKVQLEKTPEMDRED